MEEADIGDPEYGLYKEALLFFTKKREDFELCVFAATMMCANTLSLCSAVPAMLKTFLRLIVH